MATACSNQSFTDTPLMMEPEIQVETTAGKILRQLPKGKRQAVIAVYDFADQTGQHKPSDNFAEFSRAVTQGANSILMEALTKAGQGSWFRVIERSGLDNLLRERQIIAATREQYSKNKAPLPPMLFAGLILEGGIISYETNTLTGGFGARYLGIGGNTQYRQDIVTIYLRAVNTQNGEVLLSTNASKTIFSTALSGSAFKFVAFDEILELESGFTLNEPPQLAVRQAIESGVYSLVMEGVIKGLWRFDNPVAGRIAMDQYIAARDGSKPVEQMATPPGVLPKKAKMAMPEGVAHIRRKVSVNQRVPVRGGAGGTITKPAQNQIRRQQMPVGRKDKTLEDPRAEMSLQQVEPSAEPQTPSGYRPLPERYRDAEGEKGTATTDKSVKQDRQLNRNGQRRYQRVRTGGREDVFCDSRGCYPFEPTSPTGRRR
jgi:curli production assembly/transport component CsgG